LNNGAKVKPVAGKGIASFLKMTVPRETSFNTLQDTFICAIVKKLSKNGINEVILCATFV